MRDDRSTADLTGGAACARHARLASERHRNHFLCVACRRDHYPKKLSADMNARSRSDLVISSRIRIPESELHFTAVRAQGAGGQNVNKVSSAVQLRFDARASESLPEPVKQRLLALRDQRISSEGVIVIKAQQYRSQEKNRAAALQRLQALIERASRIPKARKATRPTRASQLKRLEQKARRAELKQGRRKLEQE